MDDTWNLQTYSNRLLELPHDLLLRILQLLPIETVYEACLVHREAILPVARSVLWEAPRFQSGLSASQFLNIVRTSKRHGLLVRSLCLSVLTTQDPMFPIVNKAAMPIHQQQNNNSLSDPKLILLLVKACEKITSLTLYSDNIDSNHIEQVAATAINLTALTLIGSKMKDAPFIKGLLSRIESLTLDGPFIISDNWATQMGRVTNLTSLQISLSSIEIPVLEKLCRSIPNLKSLTLTDASHFQDRDVQIVTGLFPKLKSFVLQGSVHVTEIALFAALSSCSELQHLKLRANVNMNGVPAGSLDRYGAPPDHIVIHLKTLVLENFMMDDRWFLLMSSKLKDLRYVGLKSCPNLTDKSVGSLLKHCHQLNTFYITGCQQVSLRAFTKQIASCAASLRYLSLQHSGPLTISDINHLCIAGKLFWFKATATPELEHSNTFAKYINDDHQLELTRQDIIQVAQTISPSKGVRVLTHDHVSQLAAKLNISLDTLEVILNNITGSEEINSVCSSSNRTLEYSEYSSLTQEHDEDTNHSNQTKSSDISENSFISQDWLNEFDETRASETEGIYSDDDEQPYHEHPSGKVDDDSTFPDWASQDDWPDQTKNNNNDKPSNIQDWPGGQNWLHQNDAVEPFVEPSSAGFWEEEHNNGADSSPTENGHNDDDDSASSFEEDWTHSEKNNNNNTTNANEQDWMPEHQDNHIPSLNDWQLQINNDHGTTQNTNMNGDTPVDEWPLPGVKKPLISKTANKPKNAWENVPDTIRSSTSKLSHQTNVYNHWNPDQAKADVLHLTGTAMSGQQNRNKQLGHGRKQPVVVDEGWGNTPQKYLPWNEVNRHGYNEDILNKQMETDFWRMEDGEWIKCSKDFAETSTNAGEIPSACSPGPSRNRRRADSYQSSADSNTEDLARNKWVNDARLTPEPAKIAKWPHDKHEDSAEHNNGSFFPKNKKFAKSPRNSRKTMRGRIPPKNMAGQWGDLFGQDTAQSPDMEHKPQSSPQTDTTLVDVFDEFSPNRMNVHQTTPEPATIINWDQNNDFTNLFNNTTEDNNQTDDVVDFTNLLDPKEENNDIPTNDTTKITAASINENSSTPSSSQKILDSNANLPFDDWDTLRNNNDNSNSTSPNNFNNNNNNNNNNIPLITSNASTTTTNYFTTTTAAAAAAATATTTTTTTTSKNTQIRDNKEKQVSPPLLSPASSSSSTLFTTKIKFKIDPIKPDTIYINKDNIREKVTDLLDQHGIDDPNRLERMVEDATNFLIKKQTNDAFNIKKKNKKH